MPAALAAVRLQRLTLIALLLVLVQAAIGMIVNLFVTIPSQHPGARAANYFSGSVSSVGWALSHGAAALAIHATLGLVLALVVIGVAVRSFGIQGRSVRVWSIVGAVFVLGAGFNGASFLDYNQDANSLIMALLAFGAVACYAVILFLLAGVRAR